MCNAITDSSLHTYWRPQIEWQTWSSIPKLRMHYGTTNERPLRVLTNVSICVGNSIIGTLNWRHTGSFMACKQEPPIISHYLLIFTGKNITRAKHLNIYLPQFKQQKTYTSAHMAKEELLVIFIVLSLSMWHLSALAVDAATYLFSYWLHTYVEVLVTIMAAAVLTNST